MISLLACLLSLGPRTTRTSARSAVRTSAEGFCALFAAEERAGAPPRLVGILLIQAFDMQDARFRALLDEHFDFVWRCLRRFGVPQSEVDAAAERVFVFAARRLDAVAGASERAFLLDAAIRVAAAERQRARRKTSVRCHGGELTRPSGVATFERARPIAQEIFDSMSIEHCVVLVLSEVEALPARTIAELLGVPEAAVSARLEQARGRLRDGARVMLRLWANG